MHEAKHSFIFSVPPFSEKSHYVCSVFRRRLKRQRQSVCVLTSHFIRLISPMSLIKILRSNASYCVAPLRVSVFFILRVSPKAKASAFQSLHSLLSLNTEYGGQRRIVLAIINNNPSIPPRLRSLKNHTTCAPCFAEGLECSRRQRVATLPPLAPATPGGRATLKLTF